MDADQSKSSRRQISSEPTWWETGALHPEFDAPVGPAVDLVAEDLVAEDDLQEGCVVQLLSSGQGDALGQGGGHGAQLEPFG